MRWYQLFYILLILGACSTKPSAPNKFSDPVLIKIYDLKDRRASDSLLAYLHSENPTYRREVSIALASVQDSVASIGLGNALLEDPDMEVRSNAAFALGQTPGFRSVNALIPALHDQDRRVVRQALEALGKVVEMKDLDALCEYQTADTLLEEGLAWAFYRLAVRNKADSTVTNKAADLLTASNSFQTRLGAANYFGRSAKVQGKGFGEALINAALHDVRPEVRMMAVSGFRHMAVEKILSVLQNIIHSDKDYRVRTNAVRVCQNFPLTETQSVVFASLRDSAEMVQVAASEVIRNLSDRYPFKRLSEDLRESKSWRVKSNLCGALLKSIPYDNAVEEIITLYNQAPVYFKSALAMALGEARYPQNKKALGFLSQELKLATNAKVVCSSAAAALVSLDRNSNESISKKEFLEIYKNAIVQGDEAVIGIVASALTDTALHYKMEVKDLQFLYEAKTKLVLPKDIESLGPLGRAIAYLEGKENPMPLKNEFNHPIEWKLVMTIPIGQKVEVKTSKGNIILRLFVEEAPGAVANFVELTNKKYFDGKYFHRAVPNFVIQTGCNRGDGYGSEDYSIRSEFSLRRYTSGSVGMASAGKDTEGTQWFITHSPTPHLDSRYSLFAEVEKGLKIVDSIEVGDRILEVRLIP